MDGRSNLPRGAERRTERAEYGFAVKEYGSEDPPWLLLEPRDGGLAIWQDRLVGLDLRPGTTMEEAQELARILNESVRCVVTTKLPKG